MASDRRKELSNDRQSPSAPSPAPGVAALILVPTRELALQVSAHIDHLSLFCAGEIRSANLAGEGSTVDQQMYFSPAPAEFKVTGFRRRLLSGVIFLIGEESDGSLLKQYQIDALLSLPSDDTWKGTVWGSRFGKVPSGGGYT